MIVLAPQLRSQRWPESLIHVTLKFWVARHNRHRRHGNAHLRGSVKETETSIFEEQYRVVAVENDRLLLRGTLSGQVLTIVSHAPEVPLTQEDYPLGKLVVLTDPSTATPN